MCAVFWSLQLLKHSSTAVLWEPDLLQVMEVVEKIGVKELSQEAAQALRLLLTQVHIQSYRTTTHTTQGQWTSPFGFKEYIWW